ncbi:hypothetical protein CEXT_623031 [Caerostris extrusa]|uniref:Uncharacterized protein n=1 Tax=Caerostris extrusa TaxID=172846 RepID=A0AAV4VDK1_CAEEX|nr:hypothetical protein CEXT_623031 [Caerostris extrusa]
MPTPSLRRQCSKCIPGHLCACRHGGPHGERHHADDRDEEVAHQFRLRRFLVSPTALVTGPAATATPHGDVACLEQHSVHCRGIFDLSWFFFCPRPKGRTRKTWEAVLHFVQELLWQLSSFCEDIDVSSISFM